MSNTRGMLGTVIAPSFWTVLKDKVSCEFLTYPGIGNLMLYRENI